jgi:uncharacterized membrane protein (DUF485 family)
MTLALLARQRWRMAVALSMVMILVYFGFVLLIAFDKPRLAWLIVPGLSVGILLGALVIASTWIVTWIYARWANEHVDRRVVELRAAEPRA